MKVKWSDELKERLCKGENIDKDIFSWVIVLLSIVLKKNDDGNGYDFRDYDSIKFRNEICCHLECMEYDYEMKEVISGLVGLLLDKEYEW